MRSVLAIAVLAFNPFPTDYLREQLHLGEEIVVENNVETIKMTNRADFMRTVKIGIVANVLSRPVYCLKTPCLAILNIAKEAIRIEAPDSRFNTEPGAEDLIALEDDNTENQAFHTAVGTGPHDSFLSRRSDPPHVDIPSAPTISTPSAGDLITPTNRDSVRDLEIESTPVTDTKR